MICHDRLAELFRSRWLGLYLRRTLRDGTAFVASARMTCPDGTCDLSCSSVLCNIPLF